MKEKQNIREVEWKLVAKYVTGEATAQEKKRVEQWRNQSEENQNELLKIKQIIHNSDNYYFSKKFNADAAWQKVYSKSVKPGLTTHQKSTPKTIFARFYKYAAIIVLALTMGWVGYYAIQNTLSPNFEEVATSKKQVTELVLPDGSVVTLNSNSQLAFPKKFNSNVREVTITGEAYFDVVPNPDKPFVIHAGNAKVEVLGTSFNVRTNLEYNTVEVVVENGKVQVSRENNEGSEIILTPGEKGVVFGDDKTPEKSFNTNRNFMAWKTHNLVFNETPLNEVVEQLKNVYHVDIQIDEKELLVLPLTATFDKKPVDFVLNVIQLTFDLNVTAQEDLYVLSSRKNDHVKL